MKVTNEYHWFLLVTSWKYRPMQIWRVDTILIGEEAWV